MSARSGVVLEKAAIIRGSGWSATTTLRHSHQDNSCGGEAIIVASERDG